MWDIHLRIDFLSIADMDLYREILKQTGNDVKSCGFICGREEMMRWNPLKAFFLIQNLHFLETGSYAVTKRELKEQVSEEDRKILEMAELPDDYDFDSAFREIISWCQDAFARAAAY